MFLSEESGGGVWSNNRCTCKLKAEDKYVSPLGGFLCGLTAYELAAILVERPICHCF